MKHQALIVLILIVGQSVALADATDRALAEKEVQQTVDDVAANSNPPVPAKYLDQEIPKDGVDLRAPASVENQAINAEEVTPDVECQNVTKDGVGMTCLYSK